MNAIKKFISRKLLLAVLSPFIAAVFAVINGFLPEGARFAPDQVASITQWIVGAIVAAITTQGAVDTVTALKAVTPAPTQTPNVTASCDDVGA